MTPKFAAELWTILHQPTGQVEITSTGERMPVRSFLQTAPETGRYTLIGNDCLELSRDGEPLHLYCRFFPD